MAEIEKDLHSEEMELKLAAARALGNQPSQRAITCLKDLLSDDLWVVRATAAKSLGRIGDNLVVPHLVKGLRDREWWVRMNSAVSLGQLGDLGKQMLRLQDPDVDPYAYDMAQYVLALVDE